MGGTLDAIREIFPDFAKARRERNKIRKRYRDNLNAVERGENVYTISTLDYNPEYLGNRTERKSTHADHLIQKNGSPAGPNSYQITTDGEEVKEAMQEVVDSISRLNYVSLLTEVAFIASIAIFVGLSVYLAIAGLGTAINQVLGALIWNILLDVLNWSLSAGQTVIWTPRLFFEC